MLEACPLCKLVDDLKSEDGKLCVQVKYSTKEVVGGMEIERIRTAVVSTVHDPVVSAEAMSEALGLLGTRSGMVEEIREVPGHWGLVVKDGDWSSLGKSNVHSTEKR